MSQYACCSTGPKKAGDLAVARVGSVGGSHCTVTAIRRRQATSLCVIPGTARFVEPTHRLPFQYSIYETSTNCQERASTRRDLLCEKFPNNSMRRCIG